MNGGSLDSGEEVDVRFIIDRLVGTAAWVYVFFRTARDVPSPTVPRSEEAQPQWQISDLSSWTDILNF